MMPELKAVAPGVTRRIMPWGYIFEGKKDAIVAAGFAHPSWFVGGAERDKRGRTARSKRLSVDGRKVSTKIPARGPCEVWIGYTKEERAELSCVWQAEQDLERMRDAQVQTKYRCYVATLADRLRARYPGVRIVEAGVGTTIHGEIQQTVRFQARREVLLATGLATERMFDGGSGTTDLGCGFGLYPGLDCQSTPGCWDLCIHTGEQPRGPRGMTQKHLRETKKLLMPIFTGAAK